MVQKTRLASLLGLGSALLVSGIAHAQTAAPGAQPYGGPPSSAPGYTSAPGAPGSTSSAPTGAVNNQQAVDSSSTITTSSTDVATSDDGTLATTGGEPWMIALGGVALAAGALTLRRRIN